MSELLQFFAYGHLPPHLQVVSKPFCDAAKEIVELPLDELAKASNNHADGRASVLFYELLRLVDGGMLPCNTEATWACTKISRARDLAGKLAETSSAHVSADEWSMRLRRDGVLRKLLEAKDCAVRALIYKHSTPPAKAD